MSTPKQLFSDSLLSNNYGSKNSGSGSGGNGVHYSSSGSIADKFSELASISDSNRSQTHKEYGQAPPSQYQHLFGSSSSLNPESTKSTSTSGSQSAPSSPFFKNFAYHSKPSASTVPGSSLLANSHSHNPTQENNNGHGVITPNSLVSSSSSSTPSSNPSSPRFSPFLSSTGDYNFLFGSHSGATSGNTSPPKQMSLLDKIREHNGRNLPNTIPDPLARPRSNSYTAEFSPKNSTQTSKFNANLFGAIGTPKSLSGSNTSSGAGVSPANYAATFPDSPKLSPTVRRSSFTSPSQIRQQQHFEQKTQYHDESASSSVSSSPTMGPTASPPGASAFSEEPAPFVNGTWKPCAFQQAQLLREFAVIPRKLVKKLVLMTEKEPWGNNNEVLLSYLNYTFRRLIDEKKILGYFPNQNYEKYSTMKPVALCFNSGLMTTNYERVYCFLAPNKNLREAFHLNNTHKKFVEWFVTLFLKESDIKKENGNIVRTKLGVTPIATEMLPKRTGYYTEKTLAKELMWNSRTLVDIPSMDEIIKNLKMNEKLADTVQHCTDEELSSKIQQAIELAIRRAECNPRIAVPQFFWDKNSAHGEVQLLLPLDIDSLGLKCAITVRVSPTTGKYEIRTILSLNQAYTNARLVQKVDQLWLGKNL